jgi:hypothetical protein
MRLGFATRGFGFSIDGLQCGIAPKAEFAKAESKKVELAQANELFPLITMGHPTISPAKCDFAAAQMGAPLIAWMNELWQRQTDGGSKRRTAVIESLDTDGKVQDVQEMYECQITKLTITDLDASAHDPVFVSLELQPEYIKRPKADNKQLKAPVDGKQKAWQKSNFMVELDGIDGSNCSKVSGMSFTIDCTDDFRCNTKHAYKIPYKTTYADLKLTIAQRYAEPFYKAFEDFAIEGNRDESKQFSGRIVLMDTSITKELAEYRFTGAQILSVNNTPTDGKDGKQLANVDVTLMIETAQFEVK